MMMKNWKTQVLSVASSHQEIMKNAHTMILNDEVLTKLQEAYALEIISLSELAVSIPTQPPPKASSTESLASTHTGEPGATKANNKSSSFRNSVSGPNLVMADGSVEHESNNSSFSIRSPDIAAEAENDGATDNNNEPDREGNNHDSSQPIRSFSPVSENGTNNTSNNNGNTNNNTGASGRATPRTPIATPVGPLINPYSTGAANTRKWHFRYLVEHSIHTLFTVDECYVMFDRYCEAMPDYIIADIHRVRDELKELEVRVSSQKIGLLSTFM
jgi:hypothetical protein